MKKVAIIAPCTRPVPPIKGGGVQIGISEVVKHFKKYKPYVFSVDDPQLPDFEQIDNADFIHIPVNKTTPFKRFISSFSTKKYLYYCDEVSKKLNEIKPDIIHIRSNPWFVAPICKKLKYKPKIIMQNHTMPIEKLFKSFEVHRLMKRIDLFTGVSKYVVDTEILNKFPQYKDKCSVIYNGVNIEQFSPYWDNTEKRDQLRDNNGINKKDIVILFVGQIRYDKGVNSIIKAFKEIEPKYPNVKLMIVGSASGGGDNPNKQQTEYLDLFNKLIADLPSNKVIRKGFTGRDAIHDTFLMGDIFCAPSIVRETFGLTNAEAMATGLPVITSDRGGIPEVVGDCGLITTRPDLEDDIIIYLEQLICNQAQRKELGRKSRERISQNFTWAKTASVTEDIYDKLLK